MHPVYERIKESGTLPTPREVAQELLHLANDESATVADVVAIVEKDPATASRLLKLVNSPGTGLPRKTASIKQAVSLLGLQTVTSTAIGFSLISQSKSGPCAPFDYKWFWSTSVGAAVACRQLSNRLKHASADEWFTCGLLCQIGRLAFASAFPKSYAHAINLARVGPSMNLIDIERGMYELDHNELAAEMMADWRLPAHLRQAVRYQESPGDSELEPGSEAAVLARALNCATHIASILVGPSIPKEVLRSTTMEVRRLGIGPDLFADTFDSIGREWHRIGPVFEVATREVPPLAEIYSREAL